ncbi:MAG: galactose mutarotase [Opitutae bacterium]|jgi:aldose 1-epimerase|nr:galactose mutarotase [Opitutae bacterium]
MSIAKQLFGNLSNGEAVSLFTLTNKNGLSAKVTNYGGILVALNVPDRDGKFADVVLGKDTLDGYISGHPHFGATTGRVAGRISGAQFTLEGKTYQLEANNGHNCLHGGLNGYDKLVWTAETINDHGIDKLRLSIIDPDGSNGFPGTIECTVTYALLDDNTLEIAYTASTDKTTPFNLTNHSYFNLKGAGKGSVVDHKVQIFASSVATTDEDATLIGRKDPVIEGFNDYREPVALSARKELVGGNADIHFFLDGGRTRLPKAAAIVCEPKSGRVMETFTTEPGVQFFAGLCLAGDLGKGGATYSYMGGFCLETQDYADSVNFPEMGGAILKPEEPFSSTTLYRFSAK